MWFFRVLTLAILIYVHAGLANEPLGFEIRENQLFQNGQPVAAIEILTKGTPLFHWGYLENQYIKNIREQGGIPMETAKTIAQNGAGGRNGSSWGAGFYISLDPVDSFTYGNTAFVITLDHDVKIARFYGRDVVTSFNSVAMEYGISAATTTAAQPTWYVFFDAEVIQKQSVPTADEFFKKYVSKIPLLTVKNLKMLADHTKGSDSNYRNYQYDPPLDQSEEFKRLGDQANRLLEAIKNPGKDSANAFNIILKKGSADLQREALDIIGDRTDAQALTFLKKALRNSKIKRSIISYVNTGREFDDYYEIINEGLDLGVFHLASLIYKFKKFGRFPKEFFQKIFDKGDSEIKSFAQATFKEINQRKYLRCENLF